LGLLFTKDHPFTSQTYDLPLALSRSKPHTYCPNYCTILLHINFSSGVKITGNLNYFP
jgi:hypothetical protein